MARAGYKPVIEYCGGERGMQLGMGWGCPLALEAGSRGVADGCVGLGQHRCRV